MLLAVTPLPSPLTTPPVTSTYFMAGGCRRASPGEIRGPGLPYRRSCDRNLIYRCSMTSNVRATCNLQVTPSYRQWSD
jgi:hypothetical protein